METLEAIGEREWIGGGEKKKRERERNRKRSI